jgi:Na+/phosphate symporter
MRTVAAICILAFLTGCGLFQKPNKEPVLINNSGDPTSTVIEPRGPLEIGTNLGGAIAGIVAAFLAFMSYKSSQKSVAVSKENKEAIEEVKKTGEETKKTGEETKKIGETTEGIVNSQRTAMTKNIADQGITISNMEKQIALLQKNLETALSKISSGAIAPKE